MTRVLMVYHDADIADIEADELRHAGYEVDRCAGPIGGAPCPVLHGDPCWQADEADVLVYDTWDSELKGEDLVAALRSIHPDTPLVLTSSRPAATAAGADRDVLYAPSRASLLGAIDEALRVPRPDHAAVVATREAQAHRAYQGRRW